jgi:transposase
LSEGTGGRKRTVDLRAVINAIFYINAGGCAWRMLPHDFPKWQTAYHYFRLWRVREIWQEINAKLQQWYRVSQGRAATLSAGAIDSQSTKNELLAGLLAFGALVKSTNFYLKLLRVFPCWYDSNSPKTPCLTPQTLSKVAVIGTLYSTSWAVLASNNL